MTVQDLITRLESLPAEAKTQNVLLQLMGKENDHLSFIDQVYSIAQNQYFNENTGLINQEQYETYEDIEPNDWCLVRKDFELIYPENTVFLLGDLHEPEKPKSKEELIIGTIEEGNIPHLRIERE